MIHIPTLLNESKILAIKAGNLIRQINQSGNLGVRVKSSSRGMEDYVTRADFQSQKMIVEGLRKQWPQLCIVAEEDTTHTMKDINEHTMQGSKIDSFSSNVPLQNVVVWVDPLDATREFAKGVNLESVFCLIGISVSGMPVAGVMHQPFSYNGGRTICGLVGGEISGIQYDNKTNQKLVVTTTASHHTPGNEHAVQLLNPTTVIRVGGAGYKASLVMERKADVYLYNAGGCKLWDMCAPHAIIKALGGNVTTVTGTDIKYCLQNLQIPSILATLQNHDHYLTMLSSVNS